MFWGHNIKSGESFAIDTPKTLGKNLNLTNLSLMDGLENSKYSISIENNGQNYQLCTLDTNRDSMSLSLTFEVKKGMKISMKGPNKGKISITGFVEKEFDDLNDFEEINTDKNKETKKEEKKEIKKDFKKEEKKEVKKEEKNDVKKEEKKEAKIEKKKDFKKEEKKDLKSIKST